MVEISLYRGNLHRVPDVPRLWLLPTPKISLKDFRILLNLRSRALSRLHSSTTSSNPNPNPNPDEEEEEEKKEEEREREREGGLGELIQSQEKPLLKLKEVWKEVKNSKPLYVQICIFVYMYRYVVNVGFRDSLESHLS